MSTEDYFYNIGVFIDHLIRQQDQGTEETHRPFIDLYTNQKNFFDEAQNPLVKNLTPESKATIQGLAEAIVYDASLWNYNFEAKDLNLTVNDTPPSCSISCLLLQGYLGDGRKINDAVYIVDTKITLVDKDSSFRLSLNNACDIPNKRSGCHIVNVIVSPSPNTNFEPVIIADNVLIIPPGSKFTVYSPEYNPQSRDVLLSGYFDFTPGHQFISLNFTEPRPSLFGDQYKYPDLLPIPSDPLSNPTKQIKSSE